MSQLINGVWWERAYGGQVMHAWIDQNRTHCGKVTKQTNRRWKDSATKCPMCLFVIADKTPGQQPER